MGAHSQRGKGVNETPPYAGAEATCLYLGKKLNDLGIAHLHITDPETKGQPHALAQHLRKIFKNTLILSGGYIADTAEAVLKNNQGGFGVWVCGLSRL